MLQRPRNANNQNIQQIEVRPVVTTIFTYLLNATIYVAVLLYIADVPLRQSVVFALIFASFSRGLEMLEKKPTVHLSPYCVRVVPNWLPLLQDYKLISNVDEWWAILKSVETSLTTENTLLRWGVFYTVVSQSDDFERTLIFLNHHRSFVTKIDYSDRVEPLKLNCEDEKSYKRNWTPGFYMKQRPDGYALGLRVPDWWWDEVKASCPKPVKEEKDYACGQVELTLTYISFREFDLYSAPSNWNELSSKARDAILKKSQAARDEQRKKYQWKDVRRSNMDSELGIDWPDAIEHKYFNVEHNEI